MQGRGRLQRSSSIAMPRVASRPSTFDDPHSSSPARSCLSSRRCKDDILVPMSSTAKGNLSLTRGNAAAEVVVNSLIHRGSPSYVPLDELHQKIRQIAALICAAPLQLVRHLRRYVPRPTLGR